ncbi:helix-turn-helix domain-containing protein [Pandoraea sputorum]|uniref:helix-turn-helix domain-containing protein n=1 Tax=Pandoraea sputorum TaxID=93222 RepID=UPI0012407172|nr:helix-turn-helix domain-containing protein [Pandoraea sputorum]VVE80852.1 transcriptional regulator [Pandoraea sputorum]
MKRKQAVGNLPLMAQTWALLQAQAHLRPIRSVADYRQMVRLADVLADNLDEGDHNNPLMSLFDIVTDLIELWESHHVEIPDVEPREVLRHLMAEHGFRQKDLLDVASQTLLSDILSGRRAISKTVAKKLAERFQVDVAVFL